MSCEATTFLSAPSPFARGSGMMARMPEAAHPVTAATDLVAPFVGTVLRVAVESGDLVAAGTILVVLESMKMEHPVEAAASARVEAVLVDRG